MGQRLKTALFWLLDLVLYFIGSTLLGYVPEMIGIRSLLGILGLLSVIVATALATYLLVRRQKVMTTVDGRFNHLTVHYSRRDDSPDTAQPSRPRYVENSKTNEAYWISDLLEPYVKHHNIGWTTHESEKKLKEYFRKQGIHPNDKNPRPEQLGLGQLRDGNLYPLLEADLINKFKGRKLDDLRILFLVPFYSAIYHSRSKRTLLLKLSSKQTFEAPACYYELESERIVDSQTYTMRPWDSCKRWSERQGYTFNQRRFTQNELLQEK